MVNETTPAWLPADVQTIRNATIAINEVCDRLIADNAGDEYDIHFLFDDALAGEPCVHPVFLAKHVRQHLPRDGRRLDVAEKTFWLQFAEALGSDFLDGLKLAVNFANEADNY